MMARLGEMVMQGGRRVMAGGRSWGRGTVRVLLRGGMRGGERSESGLV